MGRKQYRYVSVVTETNFRPIMVGSNVKVASQAGIKKSADHLRDLMRDAYEKNVYQDNESEYQSEGTYRTTSSLSNFIVTSPDGLGYTVGAKKGQIVGRQYVSEILAFMDQGTGTGSDGDYWTFQLTGSRARNTEDGFLTTYGQEPKDFMEKVARRYGVAQFNTDQVKYTRNAVEMALNASYMGVSAYITEGGKIKL